jgi:hypothetical protein
MTTRGEVYAIKTHSVVVKTAVAIETPWNNISLWISLHTEKHCASLQLIMIASSLMTTRNKCYIIEMHSGFLNRSVAMETLLNDLSPWTSLRFANYHAIS